MSRLSKRMKRAALTRSGKPPAAFDEAKHRRAAGGRFGTKPGEAAPPATGGRQSGSVAQAHGIFDRMHGKPRAEMLAAAQAAGINRNTASTQLYHWQRARAAREAAGLGPNATLAERQAAAARALGVKPAAAKPPALKTAPKPSPARARQEQQDLTPVNGHPPTAFRLLPNERPVAAVHRIAGLMRGRPRAEVIATLSAAGVNRSTASVQYTAWTRAQAAAPAAPVAVPVAAPAPTRRGISARTQALLNRRPAAPASTPTPVAAPKVVAPVKAKEVKRHPVTDRTLNIPPEGTPERAFHDRMVKAASVFENSSFTAAYDHRGKMVKYDIRGGLLGEYGKSVRITRSFTDKKVDHEYFELGPEVRGDGAAKTFLAETVEAYKEAGYTHVKVHANIDVGGYAWLRYGFKPVAGNRGETELYNNVDYKLEVEADIKQALSQAQIDEVRRLAQAGKHAQIAAMTTPVKLPNGTSVPLGRRLYMHTDWYGELPLKDGPAYDTFRRYAGAGK